MYRRMFLTDSFTMTNSHRFLSQSINSSRMMCISSLLLVMEGLKPDWHKPESYKTLKRCSENGIHKVCWKTRKYAADGRDLNVLHKYANSEARIRIAYTIFLKKKEVDNSIMEERQKCNINQKIRMFSKAMTMSCINVSCKMHNIHSVNTKWTPTVVNGIGKISNNLCLPRGGIFDAIVGWRQKSRNCWVGLFQITAYCSSSCYGNMRSSHRCSFIPRPLMWKTILQSVRLSPCKIFDVDFLPNRPRPPLISPFGD